MDWQFFTIIATIAGSYYMIRRDIKIDMLQMQTFHREDLKAMDDKWERLFALFVQDKKSKGK